MGWRRNVDRSRITELENRLDALALDHAMMRARVNNLEAMLKAHDIALLSFHVEELFGKLEQIEGHVSILRNVAMEHGRRLMVLSCSTPQGLDWEPI